MFAPANSLAVGRPCGSAETAPATYNRLATDVVPTSRHVESPLSGEAQDAKKACPPRPGITTLDDFVRLVALSRVPPAQKHSAQQDPCYGGGVTGTGDVEGPASSTDNALARYDGTTGKVIQNSSATLTDTGVLNTAQFIGRDDGSTLTHGFNGAVYPDSNRCGMAFDAESGQGPALVATDGNAKLRITNDGVVLSHPLPITGGGTGANDAASARTNLGLGSLATKSTVNNDDWSGTDLAVTNGGTGASSAGDARTNLGLGSLATKSTVNNDDWSGTDLAVTNGGTGASTAGDARTNLGLGSLATKSTVNNDDWSGTDLAITNGGTGASSADAAVQNLTNGATSRTPVLTDEIPFNDVGTGGGKTTPQALWDLGTSLTAKSTPADTDTFPLNDPTAKKVTLANLRTAIGVGPAVLVALQSSTLTLSTTMTDTSLSVSLEAGAWYAVEAELRLSANNTVAIQCDWDGGTATLTGISYNGYRRTTTVDAIAQTTSRSTDVTLLDTAVTTAGVHLFGYVQVNAAGTFILRMRRASASGTHQLVAGSWVKFTKLS